MRRICISLDDETYNMVEKLQKVTKTSKADVFRMLIRSYDEQKRIFKDVNVETVMIYLDYLSAGEHIILDIDLLCAIFTELEGCQDKFWDLVRESGRDHCSQYRMKGLKTLSDILYYLSKTNLFRLKVDAPNYCTLILISPIPCVKKFVSVFLEGLFAAYGFRVKISESPDKLRIRQTG